MAKRCPHILRVRPGLMANFSGGYGYMPWVIFLSWPTGLVGMLISNSIIFCTAQKMLATTEEELGSIVRTDISEFLRYAWRHIKWCLVLYISASAAFTALGISCLYEKEFKWYVWAFLVGTIPLFLALLSTIWLVNLIRTKGVQKKHTLTASLPLLVPPLLLCGCYYLFSLWVFLLE